MTLQPTSEVEDELAEAEGRVPCPFCAEYIRAEAITCRWCGKDLPNRAQAGTRKGDA